MDAMVDAADSANFVGHGYYYSDYYRPAADCNCFAVDDFAAGFVVFEVAVAESFQMKMMDSRE